MDILLSVQHPGCFQSLRCGLAHRRTRVSQSGGSIDRGHLCSPRHSAGSTDDPCGSRQFDVFQTSGLAHGRSGCHEAASHSGRFQRQSVLAATGNPKLQKNARIIPNALVAKPMPVLGRENFSAGTTTNITTAPSVFLTPADVHFGRAQTILDQRQHVLHAAYLKNPERFVKGVSCPWT